MIGSRDPSQRFNPPADQADRFDDLRDEIVIDGAGHWLPLEATDRVTELMLEFYSEFVA